VLAAFPERRHGFIGTAFSYVAALGSGSSAWLMQLYGFSLFWSGL
jgi:hypothetical protein